MLLAEQPMLFGRRSASAARLDSSRPHSLRFWSSDVVGTHRTLPAGVDAHRKRLRRTLLFLLFTNQGPGGHFTEHQRAHAEQMRDA